MLFEREHQPKHNTTTAKERDLGDFLPAYVRREETSSFKVGAEKLHVCLCAKIKPLVDETIRGVLLNKPWYFNLEQSVCGWFCLYSTAVF